MTKEEIAKYLNELKEKTGMSVREWADKSGVPEQTIYRILRMEIDMPGFYNVGMLVKVAGGSLDELAGIRRPAEAHTEYVRQEHTEALLAEKDQRIAYLQALVVKAEEAKRALEAAGRGLRRKKAILSAVSIILGIILTALVTWDLMDPRYGFLYRITSLVHETGWTLHRMIKG